MIMLIGQIIYYFCSFLFECYLFQRLYFNSMKSKDKKRILENKSKYVLFLQIMHVSLTFQQNNIFMPQDQMTSHTIFTVSVLVLHMHLHAFLLYCIDIHCISFVYKH